MTEPTLPDTAAIAGTARRHGIAVAGDVTVNDIGLDFRVAFATDEEGRECVLRIPRRPDVMPRAGNEARVLRLLAGPSVDFVFHLMAFEEHGLERLLLEYEAAGGRTWPGLRGHIAARLSAVPVRYALFALDTGSNEHLAAARAQLGVAT